jgi:hypothetical protein
MDFSKNSANSSSETTEIYVKKVLAGSIENVHRNF